MKDVSEITHWRGPSDKQGFMKVNYSSVRRLWTLVSWPIGSSIQVTGWGELAQQDAFTLFMALISSSIQVAQAPAAPPPLPSLIQMQGTALEFRLLPLKEAYFDTVITGLA